MSVTLNESEIGSFQYDLYLKLYGELFIKHQDGTVTRHWLRHGGYIRKEHSASEESSRHHRRGETD